MMEQEIPNAEAVPTGEAGSDTASLSDTVIQIEAIAAERDQLAKEKGELNERMLRLAAEFDNFRKRSEREKVELIEYSGAELVKSLLPILDDFERALKAETQDTEYARGMGLIYQRMLDTLQKMGLEPIEAEGKPFDPNLHHAIDSFESPDVECDTVAAEYQRGYCFKGRMLRAAMVRVAVKG